MADVPTIAPRTLVVTGAVALVSALAITIANAPANWLATDLARRTHGVLLLADAQGTIWSGSAVMAVGSPVPESGDDGTAAANATGGRSLALPGRVTWTLEIERALAPVLHLTHDGVLAQPVAVRYRDGALAIDAGTVALPASLLRLLGAPLNTLLPQGRCTLRWNGLRFEGQGAPVGEGTLGIADFALAISPVRPLGDYLVSWTSGVGGWTWRLTTERGPLELQGSGTLVGRRSQMRVVARVARETPGPIAVQLNPLLDALGRRGSDEAVIESGGRP